MNTPLLEQGAETRHADPIETQGAVSLPVMFVLEQDDAKTQDADPIETQGAGSLEVMLQNRCSMGISVCSALLIMVAHLWLWVEMGWDTTHGWFSITNLNGLIKHSFHFGIAVVALLIWTTIRSMTCRFNTKILDYPWDYPQTRCPKCEFIFKYIVSPFGAALHILSLFGMIYTFRTTYNFWYHVWALLADVGVLVGSYTTLQPIIAFMWAGMDGTRQKIASWTERCEEVVRAEMPTAVELTRQVDKYRALCRDIRVLWEPWGMQAPWITWTGCSLICLLAMSVQLLQAKNLQGSVFGYCFFFLSALSFLLPLCCVTRCTAQM